MGGGGASNSNPKTKTIVLPSLSGSVYDPVPPVAAFIYTNWVIWLKQAKLPWNRVSSNSLEICPKHPIGGVFLSKKSHHAYTTYFGKNTVNIYVLVGLND